jgi:hypothetical protein
MSWCLINYAWGQFCPSFYNFNTSFDIKKLFSLPTYRMYVFLVIRGISYDIKPFFSFLFFRALPDVTSLQLCAPKVVSV